MKRLLTGIVVSAACSFVSPAFAAPPGFDDAVKSYNSRQYSVALSKFALVARAVPNDILTHYYMGLCYQQTNQFSMAKSQYEWVSATSRDPALRASCGQALSQLGKYQSQKISGAGPTSSFRGGGSTGGGGAVRVSGRLKVIEFYTDW